MTLGENNMAVIQMTGEEDATGTWALTDGLVVVSANETDRVFALAGGNLSAEEDGMQMVFGREKAEAEVLIMTPVRIDAALADFDGTWHAFYAEYQGAQLPIEIFGEASLIIENGTVNATIAGDNIRMAGDVQAGVLSAAGADENGDSVTVSLNLHEDGIMSCALDESITLFFRRTGE